QLFPSRTFSAGMRTTMFFSRPRLASIRPRSGHRLLTAGLVLLLLLVGASAAPAPTPPEPDRVATSQGELVIQPIHHASLVLLWQQRAIYIDPVGSAAWYQELPPPDLILLTHLHPDHMNAETLAALGDDRQAPIVAPPSVRAALPPALAERVQVIRNGDRSTVAG